MKAFLRAADEPWAITEAALQQICAIASRSESMEPEALAAKLGRPLQGTHDVENRDGIAIVPVVGPIFQRANLFTAISGATSTEVLATDFNAALTDPHITAIILSFDSPGGEVDGINELAAMIYDARGEKPIVAYVGAQAASGALWLASQCDEIVIDATARLGSIGTVVSFPEAKPGQREIISSQSPMKRAGLDTPEGLAHIQGIIDDLAEVFISAVARGRGVTADVVKSDFGKGGQFVGQKAVDAGLADRLGSLEGVITELSTTNGAPVAKFNTKEGTMIKPNAAGTPPVDPKKSKAAGDQEEADQVRCPNCGTMFDPSENAACDPTHVSAVAAAAITSERTRILAILGSEDATGREALARSIALETDTTPEVAKKLLAAAPKTVAAPAQVPNPLAGAMANVPNPNVGAGGTESPDSDEAEAASIIKVFESLKGAK